MRDQAFDWRVRTFQAALRLYPAPFRQVYGEEMAQAFAVMFADVWRRRGRLRATLVWVASLADVLRTAWRERHPDSPRGAWRDFGGDVRHVLRSWRRSPAFILTALATLAVGLGLAVAIFSFADGYLFRPLPFPHPEQLYRLRDGGYRLHEADVQLMRRSAVAAFGLVDWNVHGVAGSRMLIGTHGVPLFSNGVSAGFGQVVGVPLAAGRWFRSDETYDTSPIPAVLSYHFWTERLGRAPDVLGRTFEVLGHGTRALRVVGIMAPSVVSFDFTNDPPDLVTPAQPRLAEWNVLSDAIVRLPVGMNRTEGEARLNAAYHALPPSDGPHTWKRGAITLVRLRDTELSGGRPTARVLLVGAVLILLLVVVNLAHLLLARGEARALEAAVRTALGASRWRITRLFVIESVLLGVTGVGGGLLVGRWLFSVIRASVPGFPTGGRNLTLAPMLFDARVVAFGVLAGLLLAAAAGMWPAWRAVRQPVAAVRGAAGHGLRLRSARAILASELMIATVVLCGAVFLGLGIWRYVHQPLGFHYDGRLSVSIVPRTGDAVMTGDRGAFTDALNTLPGVKAATSGWRFGEPIQEPLVVGGKPLSAEIAEADRIDPGAFATWGVRAISGRVPSDDEIRSGAPLAVVNRTLAQRLWPGESPLGQHARIGAGPSLSVIGEVPDVIRNLQEDARGVIYAPAPDARAATSAPLSDSAVVWAPGMSAGALQGAVQSIADRMGLDAFVEATPVTYQDLFLRQSGEALFQAPIVTGFGVVAFVVAGIGIFGLVSYVVERRRREFGIRLALGASRSGIWRVVVGELVLPAALGVALGLLTARGLDLYVRSTVFGWHASGWLAAVVVCASLATVTLGASVLPARRAMRVDPLDVLRAE